MVFSFSRFDGKIWVNFCLNTRKRFFLNVSFLSQRKKTKVLLKTLLGIIKIALRLRNRHVFMWQSVETELFQYFNFETDFLENENFFQKTGVPFFSRKIGISEKSIKIGISEANVKTNRTMSTKWTYNKKRSFASNYFIYLKILFQFKNLI